MDKKALVSMLSIAALINVAIPVFAEQAPVFDADKPSDFINAPTEANNEGPARSSNEESPNQAPQPQVYNSSLNADQRLVKIEQQINNLQNNDQFSRVDSLQKEVQTLRGQVEDLTHQLQQLQTQQRTQYTDLDKRLGQQANTANTPKEGAPETPVSPTATNSPTNEVTAKPFSEANAKPKPASVPLVNPNVENNGVSQPNVAEEQEIYQTAYNLIKEKKYNDAVDALQKMLKKYPSGQFAANAHYWLGELYGLMGKNDNALTEFDTVVKRFPKSPRISDAQLKLGLIYASRSKWTDAKNAFKKVISHYPGTASAQLASEQLKQIKLAGH